MLNAAPESRTLDWLRVVLPWSCLALLPVGRAVEVPVVLMAVLGAVLAVRRGRAWLREPGVRLLVAVFACVWVPVAVSAVDAVEPATTLRIAANHWRFLLAGLFMVHALGTPLAQRRFLLLCAWLLALWLADALFQWIVGVDLLGQPPTPGRITGPFGPRTGKFGLVLAVLAPLLLAHAARCWPRWALALAAGATVLVVFVGGTRSGWVCAAVLGGLYWLALWRRQGRFPWRVTLLGLVAVAALAVAGAMTSNRVATRIQEIGDFLTGQQGPDAIDHRLWIWRGGWNVFLAHPVNGVGARGFRHAFVEHAAPGDPYVAMDPPLTPTHPHQVLVEILAETGLVGLLGAALAVLALGGAWLRAPPGGRHHLAPYGLALAVAMWPVNTHLATFSSFWSQVLWWLVGLYCAGVAAAQGATRDAGAGDEA